MLKFMTNSKATALLMFRLLAAAALPPRSAAKILALPLKLGTCKWASSAVKKSADLPVAQPPKLAAAGLAVRIRMPSRLTLRLLARALSVPPRAALSRDALAAALVGLLLKSTLRLKLPR
jgi:hypothetical protein